jgi:integrase/recombinase XerD
MTVAPLKPEAMWMMMKQLRYRIIRILESGYIIDNEERQKLEFLLKTKKWNPYCIAILQLLLILIFFQNTL